MSFEPLSTVFAPLAQAAESDERRMVRNEALGAEVGRLPMHVAMGHDASSSLRAPTERMGEFADLDFDTTTEVAARRLDDVFGEVCQPGERVVMKVDTQGFEREVLAGGEASLARIEAVQLELSFLPLYEGGAPIEAVLAWMRERGFLPAYMAPASIQRPSRRWLQADVLFVRDHA